MKKITPSARTRKETEDILLNCTAVDEDLLSTLMSRS